MNPETQQRLTNWGCLLSLGVLIAGGIAAFLGHPMYLLPAIPILLFWFSGGRAQRKAQQRLELEAFEEAFKDFDGPAPLFNSERAMGWPAFTLTFDSRETLDLANAQGRINAFKASIQSLHGQLVRRDQFDVDRAVFATYEGRFNFDHLERQFPDLARRRAQLLARRSVAIWSQINYWAGVIVAIGTALGALAFGFLGRELTNDELGIWNWPLAIVYLASFLYMVTYLVFEHTNRWVRYLWLFTMLLFLLGLAAGLAGKSRKANHSPAAESGTTAPIQSP